MKSTIALSLFSCALALPEPQATASHKVSLRHGRILTHANGRANVPGIFACINATLAKFGRKPLPHYEPVALQQAEQAAKRRKRKAKEPVNLPLTIEDSHPDEPGQLSTGLLYYGPVTIGSGDGDAQTFQLWVHPSRLAYCCVLNDKSLGPQNIRHWIS